MKILGEGNGNFIIEASKDEVARLIGWYSAYSGEAARPKVGTEIKVNEMYDQLSRIKDIKRNTKAIADAAQGLLDAVRVKSPIIEPVISAIETAAPKE